MGKWSPSVGKIATKLQYRNRNKTHTQKKSRRYENVPTDFIRSLFCIAIKITHLRCFFFTFLFKMQFIKKKIRKRHQKIRKRYQEIRKHHQKNRKLHQKNRKLHQKNRKRHQKNRKRYQNALLKFSVEFL